jgi:hypothetical protein
VRRDSTVSIDGKDYEVDGAHLAGRLVMLCRCLVDLSELPWVEFEGRRLAVHPVDPVKNARRRRRAPNPVPVSVTIVPPPSGPKVGVSESAVRVASPGVTSTVKRKAPRRLTAEQRTRELEELVKALREQTKVSLDGEAIDRLDVRPPKGPLVP